MVMVEAIREVLNVRKRRLLLFAEAALPQAQFQAFRKLVLDEMGHTGLEQDLVRGGGRYAARQTVRGGREHTCREGGAPWVNSHSEYRVSLLLVPDFDTAKPSPAELGVLEALLPELMTALLDAAPNDEG
jgi:hypothetical protein